MSRITGFPSARDLTKKDHDPPEQRTLAFFSEGAASLELEQSLAGEFEVLIEARGDQFKGAPVPLRMRVDALEPDKRVAWTCLGEFPGWKDTTVTWTLKPTADDKTKVEFRMGNLAGYPPTEVGSVNYTWGQVVGRLKAFVESGRPQPFLE